MIDGHHYNLAFGPSATIPPCCVRIYREGRTGWCRLADKHEGDHAGALSAPLPTPSYGPSRMR